MVHHNQTIDIIELLGYAYRHGLTAVTKALDFFHVFDINERNKEPLYNLITYSKEGVHYYLHKHLAKENYPKSFAQFKPNSPKRYVGNYGRFIRAMYEHYNIPYTPMEIHSVVEFIKGYFSDAELKVVKGEDVKWYYLEDNYLYKEMGSLGSSCMRHPSCQNYLDLYTLEDVELLALVKDDKVVARCLVWYIDGFKYHDSIYSANDTYTKRMLLELTNIGAASLEECSVQVPIKFTLEHDYALFPFLDNFTYVSKDKRTLSTHFDYYTADNGNGQLSLNIRRDCITGLDFADDGDYVDVYVVTDKGPAKVGVTKALEQLETVAIHNGVWMEQFYVKKGDKESFENYYKEKDVQEHTN